jgi:hypothetical protein
MEIMSLPSELIHRVIYYLNWTYPQSILNMYKMGNRVFNYKLVNLELKLNKYIPIPKKLNLTSLKF